jgi:hypothetical protein
MDMEDAIDRATSFIAKSGYFIYKLASVKLDKTKNEWVLKFDVGAIMTTYITVVVDDATGRIVSYDRS